MGADHDQPRSRTVPPHQADRWEAEAEFFDELAKRAPEQSLVMDPLAWSRYGRNRLRRRFNKELRFRILGDVRGKRVLDVGCGAGVNAVTLARKGAEVTGLDISRQAIRLARRRAGINGVEERTRFVCAPVETAELEPGRFDVIWGDGVLHHLLGDLDLVMGRLMRWTKPGGLLLFSEPMNLNPTLRRLRLKIPVTTEATPDERPLNRQELELLARHVPDLRIRHFNFFARIDPFVLIDVNYERSPWPRRAVVNVTNGLDWFLLSLPKARSLAGMGVLWGHAPDHP